MTRYIDLKKFDFNADQLARKPAIYFTTTE